MASGRRTVNGLSTTAPDWSEAGPIPEAVRNMSQRCLEAYRVNPDLVEEHFGIERSIAEGGYGRRQIYELVQNGADAALEAGLQCARISVVLTDDALYCANEGDPITVDGVTAILGAHRSRKRNNQIGRFGLGFKSVLAVTDAPEFFSRSGSFHFDPIRARTDIASAVRIERSATLRLAYPSDARAESTADPVLAELMEWAATVIRLPLNRDGAAWLSGDVREFPSPFVLFSSHVGALELHDRTEGLHRLITSRQADGLIELDENGDTSRWKLVSTDYVMSDSARASAGELADRDSLPLVWAVPIDKATERGSFWAFFPTEFWTTMRGILNAPWMTNSDRQNLLNGEFNGEMIRRFASMVATNLQGLGSPEDPGRFLDYLPGRGRESPQWADELLTEEVYDLCRRARSLPNLDGVFRKPLGLKLHPDGLPEKAIELWAAASTDRKWVHPSADSRARRSRVERIMGPSERSTMTPSAWFAAVVESVDEATAILIAAELLGPVESVHDDLRYDVPFVRTITGEFVPANLDILFFGDPSEGTPEGAYFVAPEIAEVDELRQALTTLGIVELDAEGRLSAFLASLDRKSSGVWESFWQLSRPVDATKTRTLLEEFGLLDDVKVRTDADRWATLSRVLLPGEVIEVDDEADAKVRVDLRFHAEDLALLGALGVVSSPGPSSSAENESWFGAYWSAQVKRFNDRPEMNGRRPRSELMAVVGTSHVGPMSVLPMLSTEAKKRFSKRVIEHSKATVSWSVYHSTQDQYGKVTAPNPSLWYLRSHGFIETSMGTVPVLDAFGPGLSAHEEFLPVAQVGLKVAEQLGLGVSLGDVTRRQWKSILKHAFAAGPAVFGGALGLALLEDVKPPSPLVGDEVIECSDIVVCGPGDDLEAVRQLDVHHAIVRDPVVAGRLRAEWGMKDPKEYFTTDVFPIAPAEPVPATDLFPDLGIIPDVANLVIITCDQIVVERASEAGSRSTEVQHHSDGSTLYVVAAPDDPAAVLEAVVEAKGLTLFESEREAVLESGRRAGGRELRRSIAAVESLEEKLLVAIGAEALRRRLPEQMVDELDDSGASDLDIAAMALAVHGVETLKRHKDDLATTGLDVPHQWAARRAARQFVRDLGFPVAFAGFPTESRNALEYIDGPPQLPELHDFQREAADRIRELLERGRGRGLLSLPTGAGKTRTAVQALVEGMRDGLIDGPVLWVAQTEELCEQAVSSWSDNWRAIGPRETLRVARLWSSQEAEELDGHNHVVVATMAKLDVINEKRGYDWLSNAAVVVVDEAHRSTGPSYTRLLEWLGMGRNRDRVPVIGLSATPFRGHSEDETKVLVKRYGSHRLDTMEDDPYGRLQEMGVLAQVEHRLLSGADIALGNSELDHLQRTRLLPPSVLDRLGEHKGRNQVILDSIGELPDTATALLFATSVDHAELLAGLLSAGGIEARAISAKTDRGARRHYVEQFRNGEVRVLTNFGVLTEGFDAPAVSAVYVARPTYSPNLYQQMIGRGLRGPLNGGKDRCLVVNVADNLAQYGEDLAFRAYEHLWTATD